MIRSFRCAHLFDGAAVRDDVVVTVRDRTIAEVRPAASGDGPPIDGLVIPGLINAHLHLELSWHDGQVPGGSGLAAWIERLMAARGAAVPDAARIVAAAERLRDDGVVAGCDVGSDGATAEVLAAAGVGGVVQVECIGVDARAVPQRAARAAAWARRVERRAVVEVRPSPHAPYSTAPELVAAALAAPSPAPASVHLAEDPEEQRFLSHGDGAFAVMLDRLGLVWRGVVPACAGSLGWIAQVGALGPHVLLVHGVCLGEADFGPLARAGASVVLCARSNLHIGGALPDVRGMRAAGVPLAIGTDSTCSAPDLDPLGEIPVLAAGFPEVPTVDWLVMATAGGARALGAAGLGRIAPGAAPGLVVLEVDGVEALRRRAPRRRVLVDAGPVWRAR